MLRLLLSMVALGGRSGVVAGVTRPVVVAGLLRPDLAILVFDLWS